MNYYFSALLSNKILICAATAWAFAQVCKFIIHIIVNRKVDFERLIGDGGMPSCHSCTVCATASATGILCGLDSPYFAIAAILAIIVMHDAMGVRLETGKQAVIINDMMELLKNMFTFCLFFFKEQNFPAMLICLSLICSIMGFLFFNLPLPKAKIFMGDGGSQTLGFILSVLPLLSSKGEISTVSILYAAAVLMIPIFDTIAAIWRRLREHRSIGSPDRFHLHHKLMMFGFSNRQALIIVLLFQSIICTFLCCSIWMGGVLGTILLCTVYLMGILFFTVIHIGKVRTIEESNS